MQGVHRGSSAEFRHSGGVWQSNREDSRQRNTADDSHYPQSPTNSTAGTTITPTSGLLPQGNTLSITTAAAALAQRIRQPEPAAAAAARYSSRYRDYNFAHHHGRKVRETHWLLQSEAIAAEVQGLTVFDDWQATEFRDGRQGITAQASVKGIHFKAEVASRDGQYWKPFMTVKGAPCGEAQYLQKTADIQRAAQACEKRAKAIIDATLAPSKPSGNGKRPKRESNTPLVTSYKHRDETDRAQNPGGTSRPSRPRPVPNGRRKGGRQNDTALCAAAAPARTGLRTFRWEHANLGAL